MRSRPAACSTRATRPGEVHDAAVRARRASAPPSAPAEFPAGRGPGGDAASGGEGRCARAPARPAPRRPQSSSAGSRSARRPAGRAVRGLSVAGAKEKAKRAATWPAALEREQRGSSRCASRRRRFCDALEERVSRAPSPGCPRAASAVAARLRGGQPRGRLDRGRVDGAARGQRALDRLEGAARRRPSMPGSSRPMRGRQRCTRRPCTAQTATRASAAARTSAAERRAARARRRPGFRWRVPRRCQGRPRARSVARSVAVRRSFRPCLPEPHRRRCPGPRPGPPSVARPASRAHAGASSDASAKPMESST